jgi:hypothetical protein
MDQPEGPDEESLEELSGDEVGENFEAVDESVASAAGALCLCKA